MASESRLLCQFVFLLVDNHDDVELRIGTESRHTNGELAKYLRPLSWPAPCSVPSAELRDRHLTMKKMDEEEEMGKDKKTGHGHTKFYKIVSSS